MPSSRDTLPPIRPGMVSVVMPYWQRQEVLSRNLATYRSLYPRSDLEIIVVDDGSPERATIDGEYPWPVKIVRLAEKDYALNPCVAFNAGFDVARGEFILLTNPEVIHRGAILEEMREEIEAFPETYVAASCWGIQNGWWYCHPTDMPPPDSVGRAPYPPNAGLHFCAMLHRILYLRAGGFDEAYRDGQGYEDNDFLWRLDRAGAEFVIRPDLITDHHPCPRTKWTGGTARNKEIFERKWHEGTH
jgi:glycosyltransferase involved in cell wall biosynthesis